MSWYEFFPNLLNMSLTASVVIVAVLLGRLLLKWAPKVLSYALWVVVLFRLLCPVSVQSDLSLFGLLDTPTAEQSELTSTVEYIPPDIVHTESPAVDLPLPTVSQEINEQLPQGGEQLGADPLELPTTLATWLWMAGVLGMAVWSLVSYVRLHKKISRAVLLEDNVYTAEDIPSPFVVGFFRPKIYLPASLSEREREYIILHERHHIRRLDHVVKLLSFAALCLHWFNPLVWVAFVLSGKDMEMSCDEAVVKKLGPDIRADYAASLLSLATGRRVIAGTPLAFGEGDTGGRIKNLAKWRKPALWVLCLAAVVCVILAVCLLTNPKEPDPAAASSLPVYATALEDLPADYSLEQAVADGCVAMVNGDVSDGEDIWAEFVSVTERGDPATVRVVTYYTLRDPSRYDPEYYQSIKDDYPLMFVHELTFDGSLYTLRWFEEGQEYRHAYSYLMRYEGEPESHTASYKYYVRYVLTHDDTVTWDDLFASTVSSQLGAYIPHHTVYTDLTYWTNGGAALTRDDVIRLAKKGYELTWGDFVEYAHIETGSGLYIRVYEIDELFSLYIGGAGPDSEPSYIYLISHVGDGNRIDIRDGNVGSFIAEQQKIVSNETLPTLLMDLWAQDIVHIGWRVIHEGRPSSQEWAAALQTAAANTIDHENIAPSFWYVTIELSSFYSRRYSAALKNCTITLSVGLEEDVVQIESGNFLPGGRIWVKDPTLYQMVRTMNDTPDGEIDQGAYEAYREAVDGYLAKRAEDKNRHEWITVTCQLTGFYKVHEDSALGVEVYCIENVLVGDPPEMTPYIMAGGEYVDSQLRVQGGNEENFLVVVNGEPAGFTSWDRYDKEGVLESFLPS